MNNRSTSNTSVLTSKETNSDANSTKGLQKKPVVLYSDDQLNIQTLWAANILFPPQ